MQQLLSVCRKRLLIYVYFVGRGKPVLARSRPTFSDFKHDVYRAYAVLYSIIHPAVIMPAG